MRKKNAIKKISRDTFCLCDEDMLDKPVFIPDLSDDAKEIGSFFKVRYPELAFIIWELRAFNNFINHMLAQNYIFVEVEKRLADLVFEALREKFKYQLLFKPDEKELAMYAGNPTVIVQSLNSEAPVSGHSTTLEKMLVDLFANRIIRQIISPDENALIYEEALSRYQINNAAMLRYARRRSKEPIVEEYLEKYRHD